MVEVEGQDLEGQKIKAALVSLKPSAMPSVSFSIRKKHAFFVLFYFLYYKAMGDVVSCNAIMFFYHCYTQLHKHQVHQSYWSSFCRYALVGSPSLLLWSFV